MTLCRGRGLHRGLIFASAPGWTNGYALPNFDTDYDDFNMKRGVFNTTVPNASPFQGGTIPGGRGIDNGDGSFNSVPEFLTGVAGDTRYDITYGFTATCLIRPDVVTVDGTLPFFKHMNQPYNGTTPGWCFTNAAGNVYRFNMSDGVNQKNINSVTTQDVNRGHLVLVTVVPDGAGGVNLEFYVNGIRESTANSAVIAAMGNPANTPIKFLGLGIVANGQPAYPGFVSMGAVWERVLTPGEIGMLAADPFVLWRQAEDELAGNIFQTYFHVF